MEHFGTFSILIVSNKDAENVSQENFYEVVNKIKNTNSKWDDYDFVFFDYGDGKLMVLKDRTSKFSVPKFLIQK